ncbi:phage tail tip fiber protein [Aeromonas veronii]|uniref:phage tail tip fiber protein n=1 Tax=Aeromonas veronii TaxID=654 RepID=UPI003D219070
MASLTIGTIAAMVSAAASVVSLAMTLSMKPKGPEAKDSGASIDRKGQNSPKVVPFGRCMVPAVRVWNNVNNANTNWLAQAYSLGVGPILNVQQLYIDGVNYFGDYEQPSANAWYGIRHSAEFPNVSLGLRYGQAKETAFGELIGHSDGEWTNDHRGDRTATVGMLIERWINKGGDNDIRFISDRVKLEALVNGVGVIDPRNNLNDRIWMNGTRESYRNPACVMLTYLLDDYFGVGLPLDAIDVPSFIELANYCDGRFTFDGYIDQSQDFGEILLDMCTSFDGMVYVEDGVVKVKADKLAVPVCHVQEEDCIGNLKLSNANESSYYNVVNVEFISEVANYTVDKFVLPKDVANNPTIEEDGFQKVKDIKLPYTMDNGYFERVKRLANKHLLKAKFQQTIEFEVDNTKKNINVLDVFEVSNKDYGLIRKPFRAIKVETSLDDRTTVSKVTAEQYEPSIYDESKYDDGITSPPIKPPTVSVPSPVNMKFEKSSFGLSGRGKLSWVTRYNRECRSVVEYKLASSLEWKRVGEVQLDEYNFDGLRNDRYDFRVMTRSFLGSTSQWAELKGVQITGGLSLPVVSGLKANFTSENLILTWDDMKPKKLNIPVDEVADVQTVSDVFSHYEVVIYGGSAETYKETLTSAANGMVYTYNQNAATGANRRIRADVRLVAVDGSEGNFAKVSATNAQTEQPSGVVVGGELTALSVRWDAPKDLDYAATEIHISNLADFKPSVSTLVEVSVNSSVVLNKNYDGIRYMRVGHYDKFGKDGIAYSDSFPFTMLTIDGLLDNSNSFDGVIGDIGNLSDVVDQAKKDIIDNATEIANSNSVIQTQGTKIEENKQAISSTNGNLVELSSSVTAEFNGVKSAIQSNQTAISNTDLALANHKTETSASFQSANAAITENRTNIATTDKALSEHKTEVKAEFEGVKSSVSQNSQAIAGVDGKVNALHTIKLESGGKVSGLIMANDGETSTFDVIADKFRVSSAAGDQAVFQVDAVTGKTMIKNAFIGDLTASNIAGGKITGDWISSNTKIVAGAGHTSASLDGTGEWRLYAGNSSGAAAPFRVAQSGALVATNANITGHIVANSGTFNGRIDAQDGYFHSAVWCGPDAYISGHASHNFLQGPNGNFRVDRAGNLHANNGTFGGTVYANKIEGDVVRVEAIRPGTYTQNSPPNQRFHFPAQPRARTVIINSLEYACYGGNGQEASVFHLYITVNGHQKYVAIGGGGGYNGGSTNTRTTGWVVSIPAGHAIDVSLTGRVENNTVSEGKGYINDNGACIIVA